MHTQKQGSEDEESGTIFDDILRLYSRLSTAVVVLSCSKVDSDMRDISALESTLPLLLLCAEVLPECLLISEAASLYSCVYQELCKTAKVFSSSVVLFQDLPQEALSTSTRQCDLNCHSARRRCTVDEVFH